MSSDPLAGNSAPRVFISYAHDSPEHRDRVLGFASFLRSQGIEAVLDTWFTGDRQDWYAWAIRGDDRGGLCARYRVAPIPAGR